MPNLRDEELCSGLESLLRSVSKQQPLDFNRVLWYFGNHLVVPFGGVGNILDDGPKFGIKAVADRTNCPFESGLKIASVCEETIDGCWKGMLADADKHSRVPVHKIKSVIL